MEAPDGYLYKKVNENQMRPIPLVPNVDPGQLCKCGVSYFDETHPVGITSSAYNSPLNLYLEHGVAKCMVSLMINRKNTQSVCVMQ